MKLNTYFLIIFLCSGGLAKAQQSYTLTGKLSGLKTPMKVFLSYKDGDKKVRDSSITKDGKFTFKGKITAATKADLLLQPVNSGPKKQLRVGDVMEASDQADLMLEPGNILVEGNSLSTSKITGGQTQKDYVAYTELIKLTGDSVYRIWKAQIEELPEDSAASFKRLIYARYAKIRQAVKNFVLTHPNSQVSYDILTQQSIVIEHPEDFGEMYDALSPEYKASSNGKMVAERLAKTKKFAIGQPAINFSQTDDKGNTVALTDVNKGKYVLIDFWASWCGPCRVEYPFLKKAYAQFKDKNFEIIGISLDDKKTAWLDAIKSNEFEWIQLCDLQGRQNAIAKAYGVAAIPQSFLIDPQGKIIAKNLRGDDLIEKLKEVIR